MPVLFAATLFLSAVLLFLVQPLIGRMILPRLGGAPAVWSTCMVYFQAVLLAGYAYAHFSTTRLAVRRQALLHMALLAGGALALPVAVPDDWMPPQQGSPVGSLLGLLVLSSGLPFLLVSTTSPVLQKWLASTAAPAARDPYFLFAASNLGSLLALLGYPLLVEPSFALRSQVRIWTGGYLLLMLLCAACGLALVRPPATPADPGGSKKEAAHRKGLAGEQAPGLWRWLHWLALAFAPSALLVAVTTYLTTDIAPIPLLWVLPLAVYLLTFILAFGRLPPRLHRGVSLALPLVSVVLLFLFLIGTGASPATIAVHLLTLFVAGLACHGELARSRPPAAFLTQHYLAISLGGALGGLFSGLVAPLLFTSVTEYPLALVLATLLLPSLRPASLAAIPLAPGRRYGLGLALPCLPAAVAAVLLYGWKREMLALRIGVPLLLCLAFYRWPLRLGLSLAGVLAVGLFFEAGDRDWLYRERTFYGTISVEKHEPIPTHVLVHGSVDHGAQYHSPDAALRSRPLLYYFPTGPAGQVFQAFKGTSRTRRVGVVGLGVGSLAAYAGRGQQLTFFELSPDVARLAENPALFTYLEDARSRGASCRVVLGDARLGLQRQPDASFDTIVVDAFSGDVIPVHLLTREALQLYRVKLAAGGLLLFHITNDYVDLAPVLADLAADAGWTARSQKQTREDTRTEESKGKAPSHWVILAAGAEQLGPLARDARWQPLPARDGVRVWTDDYSNLLGAFRW